MRRVLTDLSLGTRLWLRFGLGYAVGVLALSTLAVWGSATVGSTFLRLVERQIIDGSGQAPLTTPADAPEVTTAPVATPAATTVPASEVAADAAQPIQPSPVNRATDTPDDDPAAAFHTGKAATYRTFCVRLCDGYFWPVSFSTTSDHFDRDESVCASSCNSPARLFVHRMPGGGPGTMTSLAGVPYSALRTAFHFRTTYDAQCTCHAQPWQQEATDRHRLYAAEASAAKGIPGAEANVRLLQGKLADQHRIASVARGEARLESDREMRTLARSTRAKPLARTAAASREAHGRTERFARNSDADRDGTVMRLGGISGGDSPVVRLGWSPASGAAQGWRQRGFAGN